MHFTSLELVSLVRWMAFELICVLILWMNWGKTSRILKYFIICPGNLQTLDIGPKARGVDTRDELVKFYKANYSSNLMRLVVYGRGRQFFNILLVSFLGVCFSLPGFSIVLKPLKGKPLEIVGSMTYVDCN